MNITNFYYQNFETNVPCKKQTIEELVEETVNSMEHDGSNEIDPKFAQSPVAQVTSEDIESWNNKLDDDALDDKMSGYVNGAEYDSDAHKIVLKSGDDVVSEIDASDFVRDGIVENVSVNNGNLVITFNTDADKQDIQLPISDIFNADNYYTKNEIDAKNYLTVESDPVFSASAAANITAEHISEWNDKQNALTAGDGIAIENSVISSTVEIPAIPSNVSAFTNDAGYLTSHQDITGKQDVISDLEAIRDGAALGATALQSFTETEPQFNASVASEISSEDVSNWNAKQDVLTFDSAPTAESDNPVKSSGIKTYVDQKVVEVVGNANIDFDTLGEAQEKYNELNAKYVALHNVVYSMADGEAATAMNPEYVANSISSGDRSVTVEKGTLGDVTIPEVTGSTVVTAPMEDGAVITLTTPNKSFTLSNTSESQEPVSVTVNAPYNDNSTSNTTVYLQGEYENITVENATIGKASDREAPIVHNVTINNNVDETVETPKQKNATVNATFTGDSNDPSVVTSNVPSLTITNYNPAVDENENPVTPPSLVIDAEDSTVTLNSKWDEVTATVSDETLIVNGSAHINKLTCAQKVLVKVSKASKIDDVISDYTGANVDYNKVNITSANQSQMTSTAECTLTEDITKTYGWMFGVISSDYPVWVLNNHNITIQKEHSGAVLLRNKACLDIKGNGTITSADYGVWTSSVNNVVNVYGGDFVCTTHALYAEKGTINVYGGTFRVTDDDKRYVLNCLDASYTASPRQANINVYGGKFYDFDPSNSMSEPNGPISFVAPGYHVVQGSDEIGNYYEVVAD